MCPFCRETRIVAELGSTERANAAAALREAS